MAWVLEDARSAVAVSLRRRHARERRFRLLGLAAVLVGMLFLLLLFVTVLSQGIGAFRQTELMLPMDVTAAQVDPLGDRSRESLAAGNYDAVVREAIHRSLPGTAPRADRAALVALVSVEAGFRLRDRVIAAPELVGQRVELWVPSSDDVDLYVQGRVNRDTPLAARELEDRQFDWVDALAAEGRVVRVFNTALIKNGDSRNPELAGVRAAFRGSLYMLAVMLVLAFPVGVAAAVYLEEFAPRNRWTDLIEVNINNLAAVPSIVYGLLGLVVFINWLALPRSAPLVGGLVLALLTLPVIIISARAAIKAVPATLRDAALALGASRVQTVFGHVLPQALPGIITGTVIGIARALGETAPLLMIGMVAFIADIPRSPLDPSTALPVQVYQWAKSPDPSFVARTAAAIMVLLAFLFAMNLLALMLRRKFEGCAG
ncbi:MAG: phosphate ABC transporter permease PstA [Pseudomonadota bacterium]